MLKKFCTLGLLATTLILAPTVAFAEQDTIQEVNQSGTAAGRGSRVRQNARQTSRQEQERRGRKCSSDYQRQRSRQRIDQDAFAADGGIVDQNAEQNNDQRQSIRRGRYDYCY